MLSVYVAILCNSAFALDKQGKSFINEQSEDTAQFNMNGYLFAGPVLYNPSYAARPDNSGKVLTRWGAHLDLDLWYKYLTVAYDLNVFSDRDAKNRFRPSEDDHIIGLVSKTGDFEFGIHYETDRPLDRNSLQQAFIYSVLKYSFDLSGKG